MKTLQITRELEFPASAAVTNTLAFIGRRGAGKTNAAARFVEECVGVQAQVIVIDPVGNWWGLRRNADGTKSGLTVFIIGGEHGDIPITADAGAAIARFVVSERVSVVIDVSQFNESQRRRFSADFAETFFQEQKRTKTPVHLVVEEAQLFVPQRIMPDDGTMYGAFERIVRIGRNFGIGCSLITQRPQSVNKEVLSQVECLCVFQVNGQHERKALEAWVQEVGGERKLVGELPGLGVGEGYVWSPSWLRKFERVHFLKRDTFDSSATPELGKRSTKASPALNSLPGLEHLKSQLATMIEAAEGENPKVLKKKIAVLEKQLAARPKEVERIEVPGERVIIEVPVFTEDDVEALRATATNILAAAADVRVAADNIITKIGAAILKVDAARARPPSPPPPRPTLPKTPFGPPRVEVTSGEHEISEYARVLLQTLVERYPMSLTRTQVATLSGRSQRSSAFGPALNELCGHGLAIVSSIGLYEPTPSGIELMGGVQRPRSSAEVIDQWRKNLPAYEQSLFEVLLEAYPDGITREDLAQRSGKSLRSSAFSPSITTLVKNGIATHAAGVVRASDDLYMKGA